MLTFDYGQRSAAQEIIAARAMARRYKIPFRSLRLNWLAQITHTALVARHRRLPHLHSNDLDRTRPTLRSARAVWVPNRNALFINIAAAFAESLGYDCIVVGFNTEEAATFPDNSADFLATINRALKLSTLTHVQVVCYTSRLDKKGVVRLGRKIGAPFDLMWSCYEGGPRMCWQCESCVRLKRALVATRNWEWFLKVRKDAT